MTSEATAPVMVKTDGLQKHYGPVQVERGVTLEVRRGQVVVIIGPSGCGKSTFLRCLNLLEEPQAGKLQVLDRSIEFGAGKALRSILPFGVNGNASMTTKTAGTMNFGSAFSRNSRAAPAVMLVPAFAVR